MSKRDSDALEGKIEATLALGHHVPRVEEFEFVEALEALAERLEFTYETLFEHVVEAERSDWHERAMRAAAEHAALGSYLRLCVATADDARLIERVRDESDLMLEAQSHSWLEPVAARLSADHPELAGRAYRALAVRIVKAGKSRYYVAALRHLENARDAWRRAGREDAWAALVRTLRRDHARKTSFLSGLEELLREETLPSFADRSRENWKRRGRTEAE